MMSDRFKPNYTADTLEAGEFEIAVYICPECEREWYDNAAVSNPEYCPYCGENPHNIQFTVENSDNEYYVSADCTACGAEECVYQADEYHELKCLECGQRFEVHATPINDD